LVVDEAVATRFNGSMAGSLGVPVSCAGKAARLASCCDAGDVVESGYSVLGGTSTTTIAEGFDGTERLGP
jgi:hypothetical protein